MARLIGCRDVGTQPWFSFWRSLWLLRVFVWEDFCWVSQDPGSEVLSFMGILQTSRIATNLLLATAVACSDNDKHHGLAELGLQAFGFGAGK